MERTAICKYCGPILVWVDPNGKRRPKCPISRESYLARQRKKGEKERRKAPRKFCRIIKVDAETRKGVCAKCGPVAVKPRQFGKYFTCINSWNITNSRACTSGKYGLTRKAAIDFVNSVGVCQNPRCNKVLRGPGNRSDQGHVDHDHKTGAIRGVLCSSCNHALGMVRDSIETLSGLIVYLSSPPGYTAPERLDKAS